MQNAWLRPASLAWLGVGICVLAVAAAANRPREIARIARGAVHFAQKIAREIPDQAWVLTTGELDDHLLLAARDGGRRLQVLNILAATRKPYARYLAQREPIFDPDWIEMIGLESALSQWLLFAVEKGIPFRALASLDLYAPPGYGMRPAMLNYMLISLGEELKKETLTSGTEVLQRISPLSGTTRLRSPSASRFARWHDTFIARYANELGVEWAHAGQTNRAQLVFDRSIAFDPMNPAPHINGLVLMRAAGAEPDPARLEAAQAALRPIAEKGGGAGFQVAFGRIVTVKLAETGAIGGEGAFSSATLMDQYVSLLAANRAAEAMSVLNAILQADGDNTAALRERFSLAVRMRDFARARADLEALQRLGLDMSTAQILEGRLLIEEGRYDEAIAHHTALTHRFATMPDAFLGLAMSLDRAGRITEWQRVLPDVERVAINHIPSLLYLAENASANRDYVRARRYLECARNLDPNSIPLLETLLRLDFMEQNAERLTDHATALLRLKPYHALAWYALGTGAALREDWRTAIRAYEFASQLVSSSEVLNDWAWALYRLQRFEDALEKAVEATAKSEGSSARVWATRGLIELEAGRHQEAIASFTNALARGSRGRDLLEALERAYRSTGDHEQAERIRHELFTLEEVSATDSL